MSASSLPLPQGKSVSLKQFVSRHINEIGLLVVNRPGFPGECFICELRLP
ncbi:hypothetical protein HEP05_020725, partial [Escherichia coli]|nr:hypothetical protein [Escherichia coli]